MLETRPSVEWGAVAKMKKMKSGEGCLVALVYFRQLDFHGSIWAGWPPRAWEVAKLFDHDGVRQ